jgi:hypothetical protein
MGLQRHLKVLGIFARLTLRDGKPRYLGDAPRFMKYARSTASRYRQLGPLMVLGGGIALGFAPIGLRLGLDELGPQAIAFWRYLFAVPMLLVLVLAVGRRLPAKPNIAVFLATDEQGDNPDATTGFQLGAYVKYTLASSPEMIEALKEGMLRRASREGFVRMTAEESEKSLTAGELRHLRGQALVAANCTYLGESLATVILFRDGASPFTTDDADTFRAIAPIFAIALAGQVRGGGQTSHGDNGEHENNGADGTPPRKDERADADWWKRGEAPPY